MLSDRSQRKIAELCALYPQRQSALLPALYVAQEEYGFLPDEAIDDVARLLDVPAADVEAAASFYTMFRRRRVGSTSISMCTNVSCYLRGAENLATYLSRKLGIGHGQTTADGKITLEFVECLGLCDQAPAMLVNDRVYGHLTEERIDRILDEIRCEGQATPAQDVGAR